MGSPNVAQQEDSALSLSSLVVVVVVVVSILLRARIAVFSRQKATLPGTIGGDWCQSGVKDPKEQNIL
jgi:hypothetical protein